MPVAGLSAVTPTWGRSDRMTGVTARPGPQYGRRPPTVWPEAAIRG
jgi:hypothetical protein